MGRLGVLVVSSYLLGAVRRLSFTRIFALAVVALGGCCVDAPVEESWITGALLEGEVAVVGMGADGSGCGCEPRPKGRGTSGSPYAISACGCDFGNACLDGPYVAAVEIPRLDVGDHEIFVESRAEPYEVAVYRPDECVDGGARIDELALVSRNLGFTEPDEFFRPAAVWVTASGIVDTCCPDDPPDVVLTEATPRDAVDHRFAVSTCGACDTACENPVGFPFTVQAPVVVPSLGAHSVRVDDQTVGFQVL